MLGIGCILRSRQVFFAVFVFLNDKFWHRRKSYRPRKIKCCRYLMSCMSIMSLLRPEALTPQFVPVLHIAPKLFKHNLPPFCKQNSPLCSVWHPLGYPAWTPNVIRCPESGKGGKNWTDHRTLGSLSLNWDEKLVPRHVGCRARSTPNPLNGAVRTCGWGHNECGIIHFRTDAGDCRRNHTRSRNSDIRHPAQSIKSYSKAGLNARLASDGNRWPPLILLPIGC